MAADDDEADHRAAMAEVEARLEADNLALRARFLAEVPCYSEAELITKFGADFLCTAEIIVVESDGERRYPCFQFDEAGVRDIVKSVLARLPATRSQWQIAFWFVSANGWLGGLAPVDLLSDAERLIYATDRESDASG